MAAIDAERLNGRCTYVRKAVLEGTALAGSGHLGPALSCVEILVALYYGYLRVAAGDPQSPTRDRFILSKGHACSALYPILADVGLLDSEELERFLQLGGTLADHPNMVDNPGVDFSSGSLGHGLAIGAGMAEAIRLSGGDSRVVVLLGDGELNEGQIWEAAAYGAARGLAGLLAIVDSNDVQVDGRTAEVLDLGSLEDKWRSFGWTVENVDGHDLEALSDALRRVDTRRNDGEVQPSVIIANTVAGKGISFIEGMAEWHVGYLGGADYDRALEEIEGVAEVAQ